MSRLCGSGRQRQWKRELADLESRYDQCRRSLQAKEYELKQRDRETNQLRCDNEDRKRQLVSEKQRLTSIIQKRNNEIRELKNKLRQSPQTAERAQVVERQYLKSLVDKDNEILQNNNKIMQIRGYNGAQRQDEDEMKHMNSLLQEQSDEIRELQKTLDEWQQYAKAMESQSNSHVQSLREMTEELQQTRAKLNQLQRANDEYDIDNQKLIVGMSKQKKILAEMRKKVKRSQETAAWLQQQVEQLKEDAKLSNVSKQRGVELDWEYADEPSKQRNATRSLVQYDVTDSEQILRTRLRQVKNENNALQKQLQQLTEMNDCYEHTQRELNQLQDEKATLEEMNEMLKRANGANAAKINDLNEKLTMSHQNNQQLSHEVQRLNEELRIAKDGSQQTDDRELEKLTEKLTVSEEHNQDLKQEMKQMVNQVKRLNQTINLLSVDKRELNTKLASLEIINKQIAHQLDQQNAQLRQADEENKKLRAMSQLQDQKDKLEQMSEMFERENCANIAEINNLNDKLKLSEQNRQQLSHEGERLNEELRILRDASQQTVDRELKKLTEKLKMAEEHNEQLVQEMKQVMHQIKRLNQSRNQLIGENRELNTKIASLESISKQITQQLADERNVQLKQADEENQKLRVMSQLQHEKERLEQMTEMLKRENGVNTAQINNLNEKLKKSDQNSQQLSHEIQRLNEELRIAKDASRQTASRELDKLKEQLKLSQDHNEHLMQEMTNQIKQLNENVSDLTVENRKLDVEKASLDRELDKWKEKLKVSEERNRHLMHEMKQTLNQVKQVSDLTVENRRLDEENRKLRAMSQQMVPPSGLNNLGNTCYFNSVMQVLCQTFDLRDELSSHELSSNKTILTRLLLDLYIQMRPTVKSSKRPLDLRQLFSELCARSNRFLGGRQQDSHELLRHLMDGVKEEEKEQKHAGSGPYRALTVVDKVFGGHYLTVFTCYTCNSYYHLFEPFLDVSLPIAFGVSDTETQQQVGKHRARDRNQQGRNRLPSAFIDVPYEKAVDMLMTPLGSHDIQPDTVLDSLRYYTRCEELEEYLCLDCNKDAGDNYLLSKGSKRTIIFNPPKVLTIHLKRFEQTARGYLKVSRQIGFETELELAPYCSKYAKRQQKRPSIKYTLYGVVVHSGSLQGGHYTACVRMRRSDVVVTKEFLQNEFLDREDLMKKERLIELINKPPVHLEVGNAENQWYHISDTIVNEISETDVLQMEAYLLFYRRIY